MKKRFVISIAFIALLFAAAVASWIFLTTAKSNNPVAEIYQDGNLLYRIDLSSVTEEYTIKITNENGGENTVLVRNGEIAVVKSNCANQICVHTGFISNGNVPIICVPNKLEIRIVDGSSDLDGVTQ